jgi:hypothetical protein
MGTFRRKLYGFYAVTASGISQFLGRTEVSIDHITPPNIVVSRHDEQTVRKSG